MVVYEGAGLLLLMALWIFCLVDVVISAEYECRNLPKLVWLLIVLVLPDVGSILWLVAGRPQRQERSYGTSYSASSRGNAQRPMRAGSTPVPTNPDDDEEFLRSVRLRAEEQRRVAREQRESDRRTWPEDNPDAG